MFSRIAPARCWVFERIKRIWKLRLYMKTRWETWNWWRRMRLSYWIWLEQTSAPFGQEKEKRNSNCPPPRAFQSTISCCQCWSAHICKDALKWCSQWRWKGSRASCRLYSHACFYHIDSRWRFVGTAGKLLPGWFCLVNPKAMFFLTKPAAPNTVYHGNRAGGEAHDSDSNHRGLHRHSVSALVLPCVFCVFVVQFHTCTSPGDVWSWGVVQWIPITFRFSLWSMRAFGKNVGGEMECTHINR